jgi:hypothetical protein
MKLSILTENIKSPSDIVVALFEEVLADPDIKGSYEVSKVAGGHLIDVGVEGGPVSGMFGAWKIYSNSWFKWGLSTDEDAANHYDLPTEFIDHKRNEYDLQAPGGAEAMQAAIKRYMIEFEKRNLV